MTAIQIDIDYGGLPEALEQLQRMEAVKLGLQEAGQFIRSQIAIYPAQSSRPQSFVSDRQRRGFFAKLKAGEIVVPYPRQTAPKSERLGQSWTTSTSNGGMTVTVGTPASYAPLVQSAERQTLYHRVTGWRTDGDVVQQYGGQAADIVETRIASEYDR